MSPPIVTKRDVPASHSRASSLSRIFSFQDLDANRGPPHPGILVQPLEDLPDVSGRHAAEDFSAVGEPSKFPEFVKGGFDKNKASNFRKFTTGQPRLSFLQTSPTRQRPAMSRRSTLADVPEMDHKLTPHRITMLGGTYLPLSLRTVQILAPFINGAKPVADLTVFKDLVVDKEMLDLHADTLLLALNGVGKYCVNSIVITGVKSRDVVELGREWGAVLALVSKAKMVTFEF